MNGKSLSLIVDKQKEVVYTASIARLIQRQNVCLPSRTSPVQIRYLASPHRDTMKINLWYSKSMSQWRWTLVEEWKNGVTKTEQHSGQQPKLRDAMNDVANTVEYMLDNKH